MRAVDTMNPASLTSVKSADGVEFRRNDKIRLSLGRRRADAVDILMDNRIATIENIFTDYEDKIYIAVTIDDDPAREMKKEMGLYLYFGIDEVVHV